tara:strand:- start:1397 stop:1597 length:201 start_codon:yes stop_codon:yes gene_type:complete
MSEEEDKPQKRSLHIQCLEMESTIKEQVQRMLDGHSEYLYRKKLLTGLAKELNSLIALSEREPRDK